METTFPLYVHVCSLHLSYTWQHFYHQQFLQDFQLLGKSFRIPTREVTLNTAGGYRPQISCSVGLHDFLTVPTSLVGLD